MIPVGCQVEQYPAIDVLIIFLFKTKKRLTSALPEITENNNLEINVNKKMLIFCKRISDKKNPDRQTMKPLKES